jgi:hypothetical protein
MAKKGQKKNAFSTCLEDGPVAEMMQKMMGQHGVGSLCSEMMKEVRENKWTGGRFSCAEMMASLLKKHEGEKEEINPSEKEEDHVGNK